MRNMETVERTFYWYVRLIGFFKSLFLACDVAYEGSMSRCDVLGPIELLVIPLLVVVAIVVGFRWVARLVKTKTRSSERAEGESA